MTEYGLFNDEGLVEGGFLSAKAAETWNAGHYEVDDDLTVLEVCESHSNHPKGFCEICDQEDDEEFPYLMDTQDD